MSEGKPRLINEGPFFAQLWESVLFDPNLKSTDKVVYAVLQRYATQYGNDSVFPSQQTIAERINMDRGAVNSALQNLEKHGHIKRERQGNNWVVTINQPVGKSHKHVGKSDTRLLENPPMLVAKPSTIKEIQSNAESTEILMAQSAQKKPSTRGSRIPADWEPNATLTTWATGELGLSDSVLQQQAIRFREHWLAEAGQKASKANWDLAFRTWMRNYVEWSAKPSKNGNGKHDAAGDEAMAAWVKVAEELQQPGSAFPDGKIPRRIFRAAQAIGGMEAIDVTNGYHRRDFMVAYRELGVAS